MKLCARRFNVYISMFSESIYECFAIRIAYMGFFHVKMFMDVIRK